MSLQPGHTCPITCCDMTKREQLIGEIAAFCASRGLSEREFSEIAVQNPKFMGRLRRGIVTSRSMDVAETFMWQNALSGASDFKQMLDTRRRKLPTRDVFPAPQAAA